MDTLQNINHKKSAALTLHFPHCIFSVLQTKLHSNSMPPMSVSQLREPEKCLEDSPRWESNGAGGMRNREGSINSMISNRSRRESELHQDQQHEQDRDQSRSRECRQQQQNHHDREQPQKQQQQQQSQHYNDTENSSELNYKKSSSSSKLPLPGFHQAFGSTEIGRFSRSEFFANMVGESNNVSTGTNRNSCNTTSNDRCEIVDNNSDDLEDSSETSVVENNVAIRQTHNQRDTIATPVNVCNTQTNVDNVDDVTNCTNDPSFNNSIALATDYYNDVRSPGPSGIGAISGGTTMPRWHSPYVNAIGSEI